MSELHVGDKAPDFTLPESPSKFISLSDFKGKKNVVLYFYPKDDTPGCTKEACDFRDNLARLNQGDTMVLGVSKNDLSSHEKFKEKYHLTFPLLSDNEGEVWELYGVDSRTTFLIDKEGMLREIWRNVKVDGHVEEIMGKIQALS